MRSHDRLQSTDHEGQRTENGGQRTKARGQRKEDRGQGKDKIRKEGGKKEYMSD